jgi:hypothetical protein
VLWKGNITADSWDRAFVAVQLRCHKVPDCVWWRAEIFEMRLLLFDQKWIANRVCTYSMVFYVWSVGRQPDGCDAAVDKDGNNLFQRFVDSGMSLPLLHFPGVIRGQQTCWGNGSVVLRRRRWLWPKSQRRADLSVHQVLGFDGSLPSWETGDERWEGRRRQKISWW